MCPYFATGVVMLWASSLLKDATLTGVIRANEFGGPPVAGVQVTARGANPARSLNDGTFTLEFPTKRPGEVVHVTVGRSGHVVVNEVQLRLALPLDADAEPLIILLCKCVFRRT